jgi:hypothetical protein
MTRTLRRNNLPALVPARVMGDEGEWKIRGAAGLNGREYFLQFTASRKKSHRWIPLAMMG